MPLMSRTLTGKYKYTFHLASIHTGGADEIILNDRFKLWVHDLDLKDKTADIAVCINDKQDIYTLGEGDSLVLITTSLGDLEFKLIKTYGLWGVKMFLYSPKDLGEWTCTIPLY